MKTIGTREAKDMVSCNGGMRVGEVIIAYKGGYYEAYDEDGCIIKSKKLNIILDWAVDNELLYETRFRLTAEQKDMIRQRIWEYIGYTIMGGISIATGLIITIAWLLGIGC